MTPDICESNSDQPCEKRRTQNRLAQRRFRERRQNQNKSAFPQPLVLLDPHTSSAATGDETGIDCSTADLLNLGLTLEDVIDTAALSVNEAYPYTTIAMLPTSMSTEVLHPHFNPAFADLQSGLSPCETLDSSTLASSGGAASTSSGSGYNSPIRLSADNGKCETSSWLSPLHVAACRGHNKIVRLLLHHGQNSNDKDSDGTTPLIHAVMGGHEDVVATLLQYNGRVAEVDRLGRSSIHWAVVCRQESILCMLLENCRGLTAAVNVYDNNDQTPLHVAVDIGFEAGVPMLLRYGANLDLKTRRSR